MKALCKSRHWTKQFSLKTPAWNLTAVTCSITGSQEYKADEEKSLWKAEICIGIWGRNLLSIPLHWAVGEGCSSAGSPPGAQFSIFNIQWGIKPALNTGQARAGEGERPCTKQGFSSAAGKPWSETPSNFGNSLCVQISGTQQLTHCLQVKVFLFSPCSKFMPDSLI